MPNIIKKTFLSTACIIFFVGTGHAKNLTRNEYNNWDTAPQVKLLVSKESYSGVISYFGAIITNNPVETYQKLIDECRAFGIKTPYSDTKKCSLAKINNDNAKYIDEAQFEELISSYGSFVPSEPVIEIAEQPKSQFTEPQSSELPTSKTHTYKAPIDSRSIAVIIGNQDYTSNGQDIPDVTPAYNDSQIFKQLAMENLGILEENIIYIKNATKAELERVFGNERTYRGRAYSWVRKKQSNLYVYYAGHGAPGPDGEAYLVPADATADTIHLDGYPLDLLYQNLSKIETVSTTVILESCFSGNSDAGSVIRNASPVFMNVAETTVPPQLNVITASSTNQLASWAKNKENSLFTYHYVKAMRGEADGPLYGNGDGRVSIGELQAYMNDTVTYLAKRYYNREQDVQIVIAR